MAHRYVFIGIAVASLLGVPLASAAERATDKAVGSTSLRPSVPLDTEAMNAMLRADTDKDGTLSPEELAHYDVGLARRFKEADTDRDGKLTLYEFEKIVPRPEVSAASR